MRRLLWWTFGLLVVLAELWLGFTLLAHIGENRCDVPPDPWDCDHDDLIDVLTGVFWLVPFLAFLFWLSRRGRDSGPPS